MARLMGAAHGRQEGREVTWRGGVGWRGAEAIVTRGLYTFDRNEDRKKKTNTKNNNVDNNASISDQQ